MEKQQLVKDLYLTAFPEHERLTFSFILDRAKLDQNYLVAIEDDNQFIGLVYYTISGKNLLISYLAMDPSTRSKGYGTRVLEQFKEKYQDKTIFLEIEEVIKNADNYTQRVKRQSFYERNGFGKSNIYMKTDTEGHGLEIMTTKPITFADYKDAVTTYLGQDNMSEWNSYFEPVIR
ncbi:GNAT family N-acetyltransferase [Holzapfeliella floricola]|uniref:GNAT family N-acetyltransferase n=1 Tax=Holzapfeliella floricola TaxID=679249 RepID=UPI0022A8F6D7|nr:GNAT family N-acetyltransferase [Holzapfeliella floricola]